MERNDYKNKYLKYKQKYTNVLENMYGGNPSLNQTVSVALDTQPKVIYIVDKATYNNVRTLLSLGEETSKPINRHTNCIDMLIGISNRNVLKITPMAEIIGFESDNNRNHPWSAYKKGIKKIDGSDAPYNKKVKLDFTKKRYNTSQSYFGKHNETGNYDKETAKTYLLIDKSYFGKHNETGNYDKETAKTHLLNAKSYFEACDLTNPYLILLSPDNTLNFYGTLYT